MFMILRRRYTYSDYLAIWDQLFLLDCSSQQARFSFHLFKSLTGRKGLIPLLYPTG